LETKFTSTKYYSFKFDENEINKLSQEEFNNLLIHVCMINDSNGLNILIKDSKFDLKFKLKGSNTSLLHICAKYNSIEVSNILLKMGINIEIEDNLNRRPIHVACTNGNREFILNLLSLNCEVNPKDLYGFAPIHFAVFNFNENIINDLIISGSNMNIKRFNSSTILHEIIKYRINPLTLEKLLLLNLKEKIKINAKDYKGNTPLFYSIIEDKIEYFEILMKEKEISYDITNDAGMNIFHLSCYYNRNKILSFLLKNDKLNNLLNSTSSNGFTPLHYCVISNSISCLTLLLNQKVNVNIQDENGDTPLHLAFKKNNFQFIYYLSVLANLNLSNKNNEILKNLMKKIDLKSYLQNNFENFI
jgi:ankyrin repeat protein